jgi:hypothetical protein
MDDDVDIDDDDDDEDEDEQNQIVDRAQEAQDDFTSPERPRRNI